MASMKKEFARWQANIGTGLAIVLPVVLSIVILFWLFGSVTNVTNNLFFFVPYLVNKGVLDGAWIYENWEAMQTKEAPAKMFWYWRCVALVLALFILGIVGGLARLYFGKQLIKYMDNILYRVPLLNKIYSAIKQINNAFTTNNRSTFKHVVIVEWPRPGVWSIGFTTGDNHPEANAKTGEHIISIFVPTTPNPTTGFLVLLPEDKVKVMDMTVADGITYIMSLGSVAPGSEKPDVEVIEGAEPSPLPAPQSVPPPPPEDKSQAQS